MTYSIIVQLEKESIIDTLGYSSICNATVYILFTISYILLYLIFFQQQISSIRAFFLVLCHNILQFKLQLTKRALKNISRMHQTDMLFQTFFFLKFSITFWAIECFCILQLFILHFILIILISDITFWILRIQSFIMFQHFMTG